MPGWDTVNHTFRSVILYYLKALPQDLSQDQILGKVSSFFREPRAVNPHSVGTRNISDLRTVLHLYLSPSQISSLFYGKH
jgi:hypothetical protein